MGSMIRDQLSASPLASLCSLITDGTHDTPKTQPNGFPLIKGKDISKGYIDFSGCDFISENEHEIIIKRSKPESGDTLFANIGSIGDAAFVNTDREFSIKNVALFKPDPNVVDARYLFYLLKSPMLQSGLLAQRAGAAQPFLGLATLRSFEVCYHKDVRTQRRIASILGAYDDLIEVNRRRVKLLEEMARGLFEEWFVCFRFPGHETVPILDTPNGKLPEGWHWGKFDNLTDEIRQSVTPAEVDAETPYIGLEHLPRRSTTLSDWGNAANVSSLKLRFQRGDILFGKIRPYFHKVAWAPVDGVCSTDAIVWRPKKGATAQALAIASSDDFVAHSVQTSNGTKMPRANQRVLAAYTCPLATLDISDRFERMAFPLVDLAASLQAANQHLAASRDLLLPRLISGQLSVEAAEQKLAAE
jgi:type I restriction enzyme S subunit